MFSDGLVFFGRKCFHAMSQKRALSHVISFAGNYRLFAHSDVSFRFNGECDNIVLELEIVLINRMQHNLKTNDISINPCEKVVTWSCEKDFSSLS